jgi:hypothetical protein
MKRLLNYIILPFGIIAFISCCSTVPKEVVELSYVIGEDISAVQLSYTELIHSHFEMLRQERIRYVDEEWVPLYIREWIKDGHLLEVAKGDFIWSEEEEEFVQPTSGKEEEQLLNTVILWSQAAVEEIQNKKAELVDTLYIQEDSLKIWVTDAFNRIYRGNAAITAHLNSLREVQEVQDDFLAALNLKDIRDKINSSLITVSDKAKDGLDKIRKADGIITGIKKKINNEQ